MVRSYVNATAILKVCSHGLILCECDCDFKGMFTQFNLM